MICPICNASIPDGSDVCASCGADLSARHSDAAVDFLFCEGCGARLSSQDRTCPKCGRPAPGILSEQSSASDLAAGRTASFPKLTSDMIAGAVPAPGSSDAFRARDDQATSVLDADDLAAAQSASVGRSAVSRPRPVVSDEVLSQGEDAYARPRRPRWLVAAVALTVFAGAGWFVTADPLGVMPGLIDSFDRAASEMYPSRQVAEGGSGDASGDSAAEADSADQLAEDPVLTDAEAFQVLSAIYAEITSYQDALGPVIETYNGQYLLKDLEQRQSASQGAYELRETIQQTIDELDGMKLSEDTAYAEDVGHLRQLATWMFNRVDVLCRSWDISLSVPQGERPADHQDEILAPLREVEMIDGRAVDVIEYEKNVYAWKPVEK